MNHASNAWFSLYNKALADLIQQGLTGLIQFFIEIKKIQPLEQRKENDAIAAVPCVQFGIAAVAQQRLHLPGVQLESKTQTQELIA